MAEADASTGSAQTNASESAPSAQTDSQARGNGQAVSAEALKPLVMQLVRDALNADARRGSGTEKQPTQTQTSNGAPPSAQASVDLRVLDRALTRTGHNTRLSEAAYRGLELAFKHDAPTNVDEWVSSYFGAGGSAPTQPTTATTQTAQPVGPPQSDRGAPPAPRVPLEEAELWTMSNTDREALIQSKGYAWYSAQLRSQLKGKPLKVGR